MNLVAIIGKVWHITNVPKISVPRMIGTLHHRGELLRGGSLKLQKTLNWKPERAFKIFLFWEDENE